VFGVFRELEFYKGNVSVEESKKVLELLLKPLMPLFGVFDVSWFFSSSPRFVVTRVGNAVRLFIQTTPKVKKVAHFLFPFRVGKVEKPEVEKKRLSVPSFYVARDSFIELTVKLSLTYLSFRFFRLFGVLFGLGKGYDEEGRLHLFFITNPVRFLSFELSRYPSIHLKLLEIALRSVTFNSNVPLFRDDFGNTIGLDNFDPIAHTLVIGESGSGKSVFTLMYLYAIHQRFKGKVKMVVLDPHGELSKRFPGKKKVIDFTDEYIDPFTIEGEFSPMMVQLITQLINDAMGGNKYAERVVFHAVYLLGSIGQLSLQNLHDLLSDEMKRMEFVSLTDNEEVKRFFDNEFQDIYTKFYDRAILPIINFISEYQLYIQHLKKKVSLNDLIQKNDVVIVTFDPHRFSKRMIHFLGSAIINQMYILALTGKFKLPTLLVIDEVARMESPIMKNILAETRKFNLFLFIVTQYLSQLREDIVNAILSNVRNVVSFKLHKNDAALLAGAMDLKIEEHFREILSVGEIEEKKKQLFIELSAREVVVRLFDGKQYLTPTKTRTVDVSEWIKQ